MPTTKEYISRVELRKRLGISKPAERKAMDAGRLKLELYRGLWQYDWYANRKLFIESARDPYRYTAINVSKRNGKSGSGKIKPRKKATMEQEDHRGNHPIDLIEEPPDADGDFQPGMSRMKAETVKQLYLAKRAKLDFLRNAGLLVEMEKIKREAEEIAVRLQKAILAIPDRVSELYASMTDAREIHTNLVKELSYALSSLKDVHTVIKQEQINNSWGPERYGW